MSLLFELDSAIAESQTLYRTIDFFSACQVVGDRKLMVARSDTFQDRNEGVERLLAQLEAVSAGGGCGGMGWHDQETARREHEYVKSSCYVSCWSKNPDSVAMWSLYSPDFQSVRIATSAAKLCQVAENLLKKYNVRRFERKDLDNLVIASIAGRIASVNYVSLTDIAKTVTRKAKAQLRIADRYKRKGLELPTLSSINSSYWLREEKRRLPVLRETGYLKDKSFKHEEEIRLSVRLGQASCTEGILKYGELFDPGHEHNILLKKNLSCWSHLQPKDVPEREFVDCPSDFVESVAIDPRCPPHKAAFMRRWFEERLIRVEQSDCFGYLPGTFEVFPTE